VSTLRYLADQDLRFEIVLAVRRIEPAIEIHTAAEFGLSAASDDQVLEFAANNGYVVVSHDVNTMKGRAEQRVADRHPMRGLFLVPQDRLTRDVRDSLHVAWAASEAEEWHGKVSYLPF
jgi:hypothetical protein